MVPGLEKELVPTIGDVKDTDSSSIVIAGVDVVPLESGKVKRHKKGICIRRQSCLDFMQLFLVAFDMLR